MKSANLKIASGTKLPLCRGPLNHQRMMNSKYSKLSERRTRKSALHAAEGFEIASPNRSSSRTRGISSRLPGIASFTGVVLLLTMALVSIDLAEAEPYPNDPGVVRGPTRYKSPK